MMHQLRPHRPGPAPGQHGRCQVLKRGRRFRRCAITGEHTLPVLEAAHIKSFAREGFNNTFNGKAYNRLHGESLACLPDSPHDRPRADLLTWHNENVFEKDGDYAL